jgi:hypothetical protein
MPIVSSFYGIAVRMYFDDPLPPHYHASYQDFEALVAIGTGEILDGSLPRKPAAIVRRWAIDRHAELMANWRRGAELEPMEMIPGADVHD